MDEFGPILATRELVWEDADGVSHTGYVDLGMPTERPAANAGEHACWFCKVRLRQLGDDRISKTYGEDAIQALHLALVMAGVMVSQCEIADRLDWAVLPNYGFPALSPAPTD